jgi:aminoglycoside phosphotransferase (APT) family kinase protein
VEDETDRLRRWFAAQLPGWDGVRLDGLDRLEAGHSAEMLRLSVLGEEGTDQQRMDVVVKLRPVWPGLLEPYDLGRQFRILQALEPTSVPAPPALWHDPTGEVLGRELYVMASVPGTAYERVVPDELDDDPARIPRMLASLVDHLAEIHTVDLDATGLADLGDGVTYLDRELDHWSTEMARVQRGPLPALERLHHELRRQRPAATDRVTLVHGDAKPGNFGFVDDEVTAVFDWEMTDVGDPLADIGYLELMWRYPVGLTSRPSAPPIDGLLERWSQRTGIELHDRLWYLALQSYKTAVILLVGSMLFEAGHSDDMRYLEMGLGVDLTTQPGLQALGIDEHLEAGPVLPSDERIEAAQVRARKGS